MDVKTQKASCEKHGDYEQKTMQIGGKEMITSRCPECDKERGQEQEQRQKAMEEYNRQHHIRGCVTRFENSIPKRFQDATFDNYNPVCKEASAALKACSSYADKFESIGAKGAGLIFCGTLGTGKTHLAVSIGKHLVRKGVEVYYRNLTEIIRDIRSTWNDPDASEDILIRKLTNYGLLIIDEIGVQSGTENERNILFQIINGRYENMLPTIIISNLTESEIAQMISERSVDRIKEGGGGTIVFNWGSYRSRGAA